MMQTIQHDLFSLSVTLPFLTPLLRLSLAHSQSAVVWLSFCIVHGRKGPSNFKPSNNNSSNHWRCELSHVQWVSRISLWQNVS